MKLFSAINGWNFMMFAYNWKKLNRKLINEKFKFQFCTCLSRNIVKTVSTFETCGVACSRSKLVCCLVLSHSMNVKTESVSSVTNCTHYWTCSGFPIFFQKEGVRNKSLYLNGWILNWISSILCKMQKNSIIVSKKNCDCCWEVGWAGRQHSH